MMRGGSQAYERAINALNVWLFWHFAGRYWGQIAILSERNAGV